MYRFFIYIIFFQLVSPLFASMVSSSKNYSFLTNGILRLHVAIETEKSFNEIKEDLASLQRLGLATYEIRRENRLGQTPLHIAAQKNRPDIIQLLIETYQADIDTIDSNDHTPLFYAYIYNNIDSVAMLIIYGANQSCIKMIINNAYIYSPTNRESPLSLTTFSSEENFSYVSDNTLNQNASGPSTGTKDHSVNTQKPEIPTIPSARHWWCWCC